VVTGAAGENTGEDGDGVLLGCLSRVLCLEDGILTLLAELVVLGNGIGGATDLEGASLLSVLKHEVNRSLVGTGKTVVLVHHTRVVRGTIDEGLVSGVVTLKPVVCSLNTLESDIVGALVATKLGLELDGLNTLWQSLLERNGRGRRAHGSAGQRRELLSGLGEALKLTGDDRIGIKVLERGDTRDLLDITSSLHNNLSARSIRLEVEDDILTVVDDIECELLGVEVVLGEGLVDESLLHRIVCHADDEGNDLTIDLQRLLELKIEHMSIDETTSDDGINDSVSTRNRDLLHSISNDITVIKSSSKSVVRIARSISMSMTKARLQSTKLI